MENEVMEDDERSEHEYDSDMLSEEDFPSLREWMDDRQLLYKERGRVVMEPLLMRDMVSLMLARWATVVGMMSHS